MHTFCCGRRKSLSPITRPLYDKIRSLLPPILHFSACLSRYHFPKPAPDIRIRAQWHKERYYQVINVELNLKFFDFMKISLHSDDSRRLPFLQNPSSARLLHILWKGFKIHTCLNPGAGLYNRAGDDFCLGSNGLDSFFADTIENQFSVVGNVFFFFTKVLKF